MQDSNKNLRTQNDSKNLHPPYYVQCIVDTYTRPIYLIENTYPGNQKMFVLRLFMGYKIVYSIKKIIRHFDTYLLIEDQST